MKQYTNGESISKEDFNELLKLECLAIREHATANEIGKLHTPIMSISNCVYDQMADYQTYRCDNLRALTRPIGVNSDRHAGESRFVISHGNTSSPIEALAWVFPREADKLVPFIKGETDIFPEITI